MQVDGRGKRTVTRQLADAAARELTAQRRTEAMKDEWLAVLSHELRTPINAITGFGTILADGLAGPLSPQQRDYLSKMLQAADGLLARVDDMLELGRLRAGQFMLATAPLQFEVVAASAIAQWEPVAELKGLRLAGAIAPPLPAIVADEQRLGRVVANLVANAIKFTPAGGCVTLAAWAEGDGLRIEVRDDGPGISPEDVPRLFRPFSQLDMSATRRAGGLGIGLTLCKALVEAHGGQIGVASQPGNGSAFWFWLPGARAS
jgi:signal transduction histidine kinase